MKKVIEGWVKQDGDNLIITFPSSKGYDPEEISEMFDGNLVSITIEDKLDEM